MFADITSGEASKLSRVGLRVKRGPDRFPVRRSLFGR
jgi:hypothetical protein